MTQEELQNIINQFNEDDLKQKAIFGIFQYGSGSDESYIKANKEGLEFFALQMLRASIDTDNILSDEKKNIITFDYTDNWIDDNSDTLIQYIEPRSDTQTKRIEDTKLSFFDKLIPYGCFLVLIIGLIVFIIGIIKIYEWVK